MNKILTSFARNTVFANISLVIILFSGILAGSLMIREFFPEFSLDMITIQVVFPGADPEEVEEGINQKIEEAVEGLEGIKQITTQSHENVASVNIEVRETFDVSDVLDKVRSRVDAISTFPQDAEKPIISELTLRDAVVAFYLSGEMSEHRLKEWAERIKDDIQQIPVVSKAEVFGTRDYEIGIEVSEARLREYGLTFEAVARAVRQSNMNLAGGTIRTKGEEIRIRTLGRKYTGRELASIVVLARPGGELITLDRLATIDDGFSEDPITATINGEPAALIIVFKTAQEDAIAISEAVRAYLNEKQQVLPEGINVGITFDSTTMLRARIDLLTRNGLMGLCLVFFLLWIFLDSRLSFWSGMGIPIAIAGALGILWGLGATINMVSLFGLIMVLGIVVDDAIVVGEAIFHHRKIGKQPLQAAVDGVSEVGMPVLAAVVTSIVAFMPLAFIGGIMGKLIAILPTVVVACLVISLLECLFLLPAHLSHLPDPNRRNHTRNPVLRKLDLFHNWTRRGLEWVVEHLYAPFLSYSLNWRYVSLCVAICVLLLTVGLVRGGLIKFLVFPEMDGFVITSTIEFPSGTPPAVTRQAVAQVAAALKRLSEETETVSGEPMLENTFAVVGQTLNEMPDFGANFGSVQAILLESERRGIHSKDIMVAWEAAVGPIPGIKSLTFAGMAAGPPGAPIEIWIQGHDMPDILAAADQLMDRLGSFDGVYQIRSDFSPGKNEMRLVLKPEARTLGLTVDDLARQIYAGYFGEEAVRLQRGRDDVRVRVRYSADERRRLSDLAQTRIRTPLGHEVPLFSVADVSFAPGYATITRTDGMRRVAVSAEVDNERANASEIFGDLSAQFFPELKKQYPNIRVALQGEKKKMRESLGSLKVSFPLAIAGIFIIVATMFRSYVQPFVILFTIPFGIIGAVFGHMLLGFDLTIMSMFGMVALSGVVVNDAIVLIERINENIAGGMRFFDAILSGGKRRFRAIFLTTLTTTGGLAPLIMEKDFQAKFLIPMALSLAAGVVFATVLTLVLIPGLLVIVNDFRVVIYRLKHGIRAPSRESVEPAFHRHDRQSPDIEPTGAIGNEMMNV